MVGIRTSGAPEPVAEAIAEWDEAGYVVITAGQFDILVELVCADRRELLEVTSRIRGLDGVSRPRASSTWSCTSSSTTGARTPVTAPGATCTDDGHREARSTGVAGDLGRQARARHEGVRRRQGGRRPLARDPARQLLRPAGPVGLRQDYDAPDDRRLRAADRGRDLPRRRAGQRQAAVQARRQHRVPVVRALPAPDHLRERRVRTPPARRAQERRARARARHPGPRRPEGSRPAQAAAALRRPAAARRPRAGARQQAARAAPRRAARRPRPEAAQADAARAEGDPARRRDHVHPRHARPGRGDDDGGRDRDHERRQDRAARRAVRALRAAADGVRRELPRHLEPARRGPSPGPSR